MKIRYPNYGWAIFAVALLLLGCGIALLVTRLRADPEQAHIAQTEAISAPVGEYVSVAWLKDWLVADFRGTVLGTPAPPAFDVGRLWKLDGNGDDMALLTAPVPENCVSKKAELNAPSSLLAPSRLSDGRLGYVVVCPKSSDSPLDDLYMMALDIQTGRGDQLLDYTLPGKRFGVAGYSWNPQMTRGIATDGNGVAERLFWLTPTELEPVGLPLTRAITPAWSPDGRRIAFWGAPEQGLHGIGKADSEFNLYLMKSDGTDMEPVLTGFRYPLSMAWSPDGKWLVFTATSVSDGKKGIWLFTPETRLARLAVSGSFTSLAWSPNGLEVAAIEFMSESNDTQLTKVEMASLTNPIEQK